ncbi:MAG: ABC transporter permease [Gaiellaceae bacterium]
MRTWLRMFFVGGAISFRALFAWIRPWVYIPTLVVGPTSQILFFAFLGRTAHLENDDWFVVGNAVQSASLAALFGMGFAIDGERWTQTLSAVLGTPASRAALFLGRALPVLLNATASAATGFVGGALFLGFRPPASSLPGLLLLVVLGAFACTGLGMLTGAIGLRMRDVPIIANLTMAVLLIFCGVNVPLDKLPHWMRLTADGLPVTHAVAASRLVAGGASLASVQTPLLVELVLGFAYLLVGFALLRLFEEQGRRHGTLDRA